MCFKKFTEKRKLKNYNKHDEEIKESNSVLRSNFAKVKTLCGMTQSDTVKSKLNEVADLLEYASPSTKGEVVKEDNKISDRLDDVKILIVGEKAEDKIVEKINEIRIMVIERNNLTGV
ncbi:MAG: hypothetical protein ACI4MI_02895 [Christensenellales bacterium]